MITQDEVKSESAETGKFLFTTSTCPNCKVAKAMLKGQEIQVIDADAHPDMVRKYGIMQAPTLVITDGEHLQKYVNTSNIQRYVDQQ